MKLNIIQPFNGYSKGDSVTVSGNTIPDELFWRRRLKEGSAETIKESKPKKSTKVETLTNGDSD